MAIKGAVGQQRELIPAGNYVAICYSMIQIGTVDNTYKGVTKKVPKVRLGWELSEELKVFKEGDIAKPLVIEKDYTLYMTDRSNLRKDLESWRGGTWTDKEAEDFDITKLVGAACLLNIIHHEADSGKTYEKISGITKLPKSMPVPKIFNPKRILQFDDWNQELFDSLPEFITDQIKTSLEYQQLKNPETAFINEQGQPIADEDDSSDLPF
jgi:hypothetical protein